MADTKARILRWRAGHQAAERRQRELLAEEGPNPAQAVAEALDALAVLEAMGQWPSPRDAVSERAVGVVRRRWVRIQNRARAAAQSR
jgi:hypothetical protein